MAFLLGGCMNFIIINKDNIDTEHICCAMSNKKSLQKKEWLKERFDEIIDFAELKDFVDVPVKNFSSGMTTRLGFSIATIYTPDILIVDEILAVGDFAFQKKCEKRIGDMLNSGTTLLLVSHSTEQVRRICDRAVLINKGKMLIEDDVDTVCDLYTHL